MRTEKTQVINTSGLHARPASMFVKKAKEYPDAILILAHAARSFAAWTGIESIEKVAHLPNVYVDFAGVCESPAMIQCVKKLGTKRCMWGTDWAVSMMSGKCVSLGGTFYWINGRDIAGFNSKTELRPYLVGTENLMAMRELKILLELTDSQLEDIFCGTAKEVFGLR